jgi:uncharacterized Zn finger protein
MSEQYDLQKVTTETYVATCKKCGRVFRSDVKSKAVQRVTRHYIDKHQN